MLYALPPKTKLINAPLPVPFAGCDHFGLSELSLLKLTESKVSFAFMND